MTANKSGDDHPDTPPPGPAEARRRRLNRDGLDEKEIVDYSTHTFRGQLLADSVLRTHLPDGTGRCRALGCGQKHPCTPYQTAFEAKRRLGHHRPADPPQDSAPRGP